MRSDTALIDGYERLIREGGSFGLFISTSKDHLIAGRADITPEIAEIINLRHATGPCHTLRDVLDHLIEEHEFDVNGVVQ